MLVKVETIKTTYTQLELCKALITAWRTILGTTPSKASIGVIISQHDIETGSGSFCWCNNIGNVKAADVSGQTIEFCALNGVWEIINGKRIDLPATNPGSWFRAFPTLEAGAVFHLNLLRNSRYKTSWPAIEMGSVVQFATLLREHGYYTAPLADYVAGMNRFFTPYMKSTIYEEALNSLGEAPPLQPWVSVPDDPAPLAPLTPIQDAVDRAAQVPQEEIEQKGSSFLQKIVGYIPSVFKWLQQR